MVCGNLISNDDIVAPKKQGESIFDFVSFCSLFWMYHGTKPSEAELLKGMFRQNKKNSDYFAKDDLPKKVETMSFLAGLTGKASSGDAATSAIGLESGLVCDICVCFFIRKKKFYVLIFSFFNEGEKWISHQACKDESIKLEEEILCS